MKSKPRILFLLESLKVGGAEKSIVSILHNIDCRKCNVTLMLISESGEFIDDVKDIKGLTIKHIVSPTAKRFSAFLNALKIKSLYKWLPSKITGDYFCKEYDIVIAFCEGYLTKWVAASTAKCKKIAWVHTDMVNNDWPVNSGVFHDFNAEKEAYHKFNHVVGVSELVTDGMKSKFGLKHVTTIYNLLDDSIEDKAMTGEVYSPHSRLNLVSVGRLESVKGYDNLIEAIRKLVYEQKFDISLCLVGDGSQRSALELKVKLLKLSDRIIFVGNQPNPYPYVKAADAYVCSSHYEGFNIAILEAMSLGKPVISTESAGPCEILHGDKYGVLVENSVDGLIDGIGRFYNNEELMEHYIEQSKRRAKNFSPERQIQKIKELIEAQ